MTVADVSAGQGLATVRAESSHDGGSQLVCEQSVSSLEEVPLRGDRTVSTSDPIDVPRLLMRRAS